MSVESTDNRDYKYVMQDISNVYLGARYTYEELIEEEEIPFKIKKLINGYINQVVKEENLSMESHFYYMDAHGFLYQTFLQLKTRVRISIFSEKKKHYITEVMKLQDFVKISPQEKEEQGILIQEIIFSKLALLTL
ncbi:MAG TPA: hypothetical protein VJY54_10960 [Lachnospiraceae bacterium]|nr:hypothetical protein [Lachnospiraceae bacterium]